MWQLTVMGLLLGGATGRHVIDLTHTFDKNAPKWPLGDLMTNRSYYNLRTLREGWLPSGRWSSLKHIEFYEHVGTHMDAPFHFGAGRHTMDEIPVEKLMGPGVHINVREKVVNDPNYGVTVDDIKEYEGMYGRIPRNAIVLMNSGWAEKYRSQTLTFGTNNFTDGSPFNFPGWDLGACKFLLTQRQIGVLGVDTPSVDPGSSQGFQCHRFLQPNNVPLLEYVANLDAMPAAGSTVVLGALKHRGGTGGPTRVICFIDDDMDKNTSGTAHAQSSAAVSVAGIILFLLSFRK